MSHPDSLIKVNPAQMYLRPCTCFMAYSLNCSKFQHDTKYTRCNADHERKYFLGGKTVVTLIAFKRNQLILDVIAGILAILGTAPNGFWQMNRDWIVRFQEIASVYYILTRMKTTEDEIVQTGSKQKDERTQNQRFLDAN